MRMKIVLCLVLAPVLPCVTAVAQIQKVSANAWSVTADPQKGLIQIEHTRFGTLGADLHPGLRERGSIDELTGWSAARTAENRLYVVSKEPAVSWRFDLEENLLRISCNRASAVLTGSVPAGRGRMPVRLMDPAGTPVEWVGTTEVQGSFGGVPASHRSYLPSRNPECMYFSLGQTTSLNYHSIYDRFTDDAVDYPAATRLVRNPSNRDLLDIELPVSGNALVRTIPGYFTQVLGAARHVPFDDSYFRVAPSVWSSWTAYYSEVKESDIVANTEWLARNLRGYGFQYVQLDDGYDRGPKGEHWWIEHWDRDKFPHGPEWLTQFIKSQGFKAGLWLVPNAYAGALQEHPEWYLRYRNGELVWDYKTPALDSSNPEVLQFLRKLFKTLRDWGFEYFKFDGEHSIPKNAANIDLSKLYDSKTDPLVVYRKRLDVIRDTVGPQTFLEGCPGGAPLDGVGVFNSYFTGDDVYNSWQGMYAFFSSVTANAFLNHILVYVMPGEGIEIGTLMSVQDATKSRVPSVVSVERSRETPLRGFGATLNQARTLVTYSSLTGVVYSLASMLPELPEERVRLLKATLPTLPIFPADLFSRGNDMNWSKFKVTTPDQYIHNYPEILDLKVAGASGEYDVAGFTNWQSQPVVRRIAIAEKLGLERDSRLVAFDFWRETLVPVGKNGCGEPELTLELEPYETRVLLIHREQERLQYLASSRHITGAYGVSVHSAAGGGALTGESETVPGEPCTLWFLAPPQAVVKAESAGKPLKVDQSIEGGLLKATFEGQPGKVAWSVR
jgi:hypothetical protein